MVLVCMRGGGLSMVSGTSTGTVFNIIGGYLQAGVLLFFEVQYLYKPPLLDGIITGIRKLSFIPQNNNNKQLVKNDYPYCIVIIR